MNGRDYECGPLQVVCDGYAWGVLIPENGGAGLAQWGYAVPVLLISTPSGRPRHTHITQVYIPITHHICSHSCTQKTSNHKDRLYLQDHTCGRFNGWLEGTF